MRLLLSASHRYPAYVEHSRGLKPTPHPSGSAYVTHDLLARGLAELGHEVIYLLHSGWDGNLPQGIRAVTAPNADADLHHMLLDTLELAYWKSKPWAGPRIISCHIHPQVANAEWGIPKANWIYPSRTLAARLGSVRYVWNGIDPDEYQFSAKKKDYFLFMASMEWSDRKGIDVALSLAREVGFRLIIAGGARRVETIREMQTLCSGYSCATYLGDVRGEQKASLLAGARALLFPTRLEESFGLGMAEALISGTPVICSDKGACPELVSPDIGFICTNRAEYLKAIEGVDKLSPYRCRERAMEHFHYLKMAKGYETQYFFEIAKFRQRSNSEPFDE